MGEFNTMIQELKFDDPVNFISTSDSLKDCSVNWLRVSKGRKKGQKF